VTKNNQSGQSTIEFIFTFAFGVSIILIVFTTAINYATGYLVHYATFMASRVYLTSDVHSGTISSPRGGRTEAAEDTYKKYMLSVFNVPDSGFKINEASGNMSGGEYLTVGARTIFDLKMDVVGKVTGQSKLELVSESFIGKEPTRSQCANRTCFAITGSDRCDNSFDITLYDDGC